MYEAERIGQEGCVMKQDEEGKAEKDRQEQRREREAGRTRGVWG